MRSISEFDPDYDQSLLSPFFSRIKFLFNGVKRSSINNDISLSLSPLRTTALFNKPSSPIAYPNDSTRSSHSNPTLHDMISDEQNRETIRGQDEPRRKSQACVAKTLTDFKNGVEPGDVKLSLVSRDGYRVTMDVHKKVLSEKSRFFLENMKSDSQMVEISECDDVDVLR